MALRPQPVPPQTIQEINAKLKESTVKILGTTGAENTTVLVSDVVIPELTIEQQALIDAITPSIGPNGEWYVGNVSTGIMAANYLKSPDGSIWHPVAIDNTGKNVTYTKVYDPNNP